MKWEDRFFGKVALFIAASVGAILGVVLVLRAPGIFKIAGVGITLASFYVYIKLRRVLKRNK